MVHFDKLTLAISYVLMKVIMKFIMGLDRKSRKVFHL